MTPDQRRFIGLILLVVGVFSLIVSGGVISMVGSARAKAADRFSEEKAACKAKLETLGGKVDENSDRLIWMKPDLTQGPTRLGEASVAAVLCPGWEMKSACVGTECPEANSMRLVLAPIGRSE